jgi:hypothetical protein
VDNRLSEALQILSVSTIEEVTAEYVNKLVASKPNQESWIKYAFHYVKMVAGDSLPKDEEVFRDKNDDDEEYQFDEEIENDELSELGTEEDIGSLESNEVIPQELYSSNLEPYLPDRYSLWSARRRNLENQLSYLPADTEFADEFEVLSKYYALEVYRRSLIAYESHEFTYDSFEESVLEMSNYEKLELKILQELRFIGIDNDEGSFGIKFNRYIHEFIRIMNAKKE